MFSFVQSLTITVLLAFLLRAFVLQPFIVEGSSMEPNFHDKEYIIIDKLSYKLRQPQRGEVIVLHPPVAESQNYIKRIIGLPGETVKVTDGRVYINNQLLNESYLDENLVGSNRFNTDTNITLSTDEYFVMGDNRDHSSDSREWGKLSKANIEGRTWLILLPFENFSLVKTPQYQLNLASFRLRTT